MKIGQFRASLAICASMVCVSCANKDGPNQHEQLNRIRRASLEFSYSEFQLSTGISKASLTESETNEILAYLPKQIFRENLAMSMWAPVGKVTVEYVDGRRRTVYLADGFDLWREPGSTDFVIRPGLEEALRRMLAHKGDSPDTVKYNP